MSWFAHYLSIFLCTSSYICTEDCKKYGQTPWEAATTRVNVCWAKKNKVLVFCHYFSFETCTSIRTCILLKLKIIIKNFNRIIWYFVRKAKVIKIRNHVALTLPRLGQIIMAPPPPPPCQLLVLLSASWHFVDSPIQILGGGEEEKSQHSKKIILATARTVK